MWTIKEYLGKPKFKHMSSCEQEAYFDFVRNSNNSHDIRIKDRAILFYYWIDNDPTKVLECTKIFDNLYSIRKCICINTSIDYRTYDVDNNQVHCYILTTDFSTNFKNALNGLPFIEDDICDKEKMNSKDKIDIITAYLEEKHIQAKKLYTNEWYDIDRNAKDVLDFDHFQFRIKPPVTVYVPYDSVDQIYKDIKNNGNEVYTESGGKYKIFIVEICVLPMDGNIIIRGSKIPIIHNAYIEYSVKNMYEDKFKFVTTDKLFCKEIREK